MEQDSKSYMVIGENLITSLKYNIYDSPAYINWDTDDKNPSAQTQCSSFSTLLLNHYYNWDYSNSPFKKYTGKSLPKADLYYKAITETKMFKKISNVSLIQRGDIIAIKYEDDNDSTGHVMLIRSIPEDILSTKPLVSDTKQMKVLILDSTESIHGVDDTRIDSLTKTGIGSGYIRLYVKNDKIIGYTWSLKSSSKYYNQSERSLVIGRLNLEQLNKEFL